jgi:hypothetical protein
MSAQPSSSTIAPPHARGLLAQRFDVVQVAEQDQLIAIHRTSTTRAVERTPRDLSERRY